MTNHVKRRLVGLVPLVVLVCGVCGACGAASRRHHTVRTISVTDCGRQVEVDEHSNGSLYLKGTDIPFRGGESCG